MVGDGGGGWCKAHLFCQPPPSFLTIHHISRATIPILVVLGGFRRLSYAITSATQLDVNNLQALLSLGPRLLRFQRLLPDDEQQPNITFHSVDSACTHVAACASLSRAACLCKPIVHLHPSKARHTLSPGIYHCRPSAPSPPTRGGRQTKYRQTIETDDRAALVAQNHTASYHPPDDPGRPARTRPSARLCRAQSRPDRLWVCLRGCVGVTCRPAAAGISRVPGQPILKSREPLSSRCAVQGPKSPTELPSTQSHPTS